MVWFSARVKGLVRCFCFLSNKMIPELNKKKLENKRHMSTVGVPGKFCGKELQRKCSSRLALSTVVSPLRGRTPLGLWLWRHPGEPPLYTHQCVNKYYVVLCMLLLRFVLWYWENTNKMAGWCISGSRNNCPNSVKLPQSAVKMCLIFLSSCLYFLSSVELTNKSRNMFLPAWNQSKATFFAVWTVDRMMSPWPKNPAEDLLLPCRTQDAALLLWMQKKGGKIKKANVFSCSLWK